MRILFCYLRFQRLSLIIEPLSSTLIDWDKQVRLGSQNLYEQTIFSTEIIP
jgi:hypothetical protein